MNFLKSALAGVFGLYLGCVGVKGETEGSEEVVGDSSGLFVPVYDKSPGRNVNLESVIGSVGKLSGKANYRVSAYANNTNIFLGGENVSSEWRGSCFCIGELDGFNYFLTAAHCLSDKDDVRNVEKWVYTVKRFVNDELSVDYFDTSINGGRSVCLEEFCRDDKTDVGVMRCPVSDSLNIPFYNLLADSDGVELGDVVYSVGFPHTFTFGGSTSWGKHLTKGIITCLHSNDYGGDRHLFYTEATLDGGMSGGACFVLDRGVPRVLGVNSVKWNVMQDRYGVAFGLRPLLEKNGLLGLVDFNEDKRGKDLKDEWY
jgi:S1-C subfamily serine protease